jgi:hypothetical protein
MRRAVRQASHDRVFAAPRSFASNVFSPQKSTKAQTGLPFLRFSAFLWLKNFEVCVNCLEITVANIDLLHRKHDAHRIRATVKGCFHKGSILA